MVIPWRVLTYVLDRDILYAGSIFSQAIMIP